MAKLNFVSIRFAGYYYDTVEDRIYSTKRGQARAIAWSTRSNGDLYARLTDVAGNNKFRVLKKDIYNYVESESNTDAKQVVKPQQQKHNGSYIVVAIFSDSTLHPCENRKVHSTEAAARAEAERLAREHPNLKFRVFKDCGTVQAQDIVWS